MRVALGFRLTPLAVLDLSVVAVLWMAWHLEDRDAKQALAREQHALTTAKLVNLAVWSPEALDTHEQKLRGRWQALTGQTPAATDPATLAALFDAANPVPPEPTDG